MDRRSQRGRIGALVVGLGVCGVVGGCSSFSQPVSSIEGGSRSAEKMAATMGPEAGEVRTSTRRKMVPTGAHMDRLVNVDIWWY